MILDKTKNMTENRQIIMNNNKGDAKTLFMVPDINF